jgi:biotin carboxyl carrier protein
MEGRTLAIAAFGTKLDDDFEIASTDPEERAAIAEGMAQTEARIEADMDPVVAASLMDTDEVVRLDELRDWIAALSEMAYQATGHRRIKNPRIWSLHDLAILSQGRAPQAEQAEAPAATSKTAAQAPEPGLIPVVAPMAGSFWSRPTPDADSFVAPGDTVAAGDTVALVEVMKTFSPIRVTEAGEWVPGSVSDGDGIRGGEVVGWLRKP